jgi:hypothetical protein
MQAAIIYSHSLSPRLQYIVDFLSQYFGLSFKLTSNEDLFVQSSVNCKINYSYHRVLDGEIWIHPHALLFESAIHPVKVECFEHALQRTDGTPYTCFFKAEGDLHFDLFAAIFFLISRYEEYLPHQKDPYGRYAHQNSVAFKHQFLHLPLVNIWLEDFRSMLAAKEPLFQEPAASFSFLPTYDIDMAWSYRNKGFQRNAGALLKWFFTGKWRRMSRRIGVLRGKRQDPFDCYAWMDELHDAFHLQPVYFFLVAEQTSRYDKNIDLRNESFRQLIKAQAGRYVLGLHPSWRSGDQSSLLRKEAQWLRAISEQPVTASRQHFIRFELPITYRKLIDADILHDYSMGYGSINGFRASITTPYYWYDLKNDAATKLLVHPFCFMDANAYYEQRQTPGASLDELNQYAAVVQSVHGQLITIWHNSFLGTDPEFEGWREVYAQFVGQLASSSKHENIRVADKRYVATN